VPGGLEKTISVSLSVPDVRRWSPWRFGPAATYEATMTVLVEGRVSAHAGDRFGFRDAHIKGGPEGWEVKVNGQPAFLRGANYTPAFRLDSLTGERFDHDLALARAANLDALRVHAHVLPEEFYRRADAAGMVVIADLPLTLAYAYQASDEEARFFESSVRQQVGEMVELLRNRPSVLAWVAHDDPPWISGGADLAEVHAVRQNHGIDQEARQLFERYDPDRLALAASGQYDSHLFNGWREGGWEDFADLEPEFVTEFGAQSLPSLESPVWNRLGRRWPVTADEPAWLFAGFQPSAWAERGAGLPGSYSSLAEYIEASQEYQAFLLTFAIDQLRKQKFENCWGAFVYQLVDAFPAIGFSLLDHARVPKLAYAAVRDAMAPVRLIADPLNFVPLHPFGFGYPAGSGATLRLVVVNDDSRVNGPALVRWSVRRLRPGNEAALERFRDVLRRKSFSGSVEFDMPSALEPAAQVATLSVAPRAEGEYALEAELVSQGRTLSQALCEFSIGVPGRVPRPRPPLPGYLADRLVEPGSLRSQPNGFSLRLLNRTRPAVLARLAGVRLDGRSLGDPPVLLETASGRVPLPKRLELPVGRPVTLYFDCGASLGEGRHEVELDLALPGIASGRVQVAGVSGAGEARTQA
jgi:hypothetical protein